jgi:hypothetical protein
MICRIGIAIALLRLTAVDAQAMLRGGPEITAVALRPGEPDCVLIRISDASCEAAISTNAGQTFGAVYREGAPSDWSTNLTAGARRYILADPVRLFRSDDSGVTWTNTGATAFLRGQSEAALEREKSWFREKYGSRLPPRSVLWHPMFALYAVGYFTVTVLFLRRAGVLSAFLTAARGLAVLLVVWSLLAGLHAVVTNWTSSQYPMAYWNTSMRMHPSHKLGVAMAVAALPLPLLAYLAILWPILPGSKDVMARVFPRMGGRVALVLSLTAGTAFVLFHLGMMFIGYFWE